MFSWGKERDQRITADHFYTPFNYTVRHYLQKFLKQI